MLINHSSTALVLAAVNVQLQAKLDEVNSSLTGYAALPDTEAAAEKLVRELLNLVQHSYFNACINAGASDEGGVIKDAMIDAVHAAAKSYVRKQVCWPGRCG
jgi:cob(I)alamin adenosyltransferase